MGRSRFTEAEIASILRKGRAGMSIAQLSRRHGFPKASYYQWKAKYRVAVEVDVDPPSDPAEAPSKRG